MMNVLEHFISSKGEAILNALESTQFRSLTVPEVAASMWRYSGQARAVKLILKLSVNSKAFILSCLVSPLEMSVSESELLVTYVQSVSIPSPHLVLPT